MFAVSGFSWSAFTTSKPSTSGIIRSRTIRSGSSRASAVDRLATAVRAMDGSGETEDAHRDQLHGHRVVVDHEHVQRLLWRGGRQTKLDERAVQVVPGQRLLHDRRGAEREPSVAIRDDRNDHDRDPRELRRFLEATEELPAVHVGEHDVERDQRQRLLRRKDQRCLRGGGVQHLEALRFELHADELRGLRVVLDHERRAPHRRVHPCAAPAELALRRRRRLPAAGGGATP